MRFTVAGRQSVVLSGFTPFASSFLSIMLWKKIEIAKARIEISNKPNHWFRNVSFVHNS